MKIKLNKKNKIIMIIVLIIIIVIVGISIYKYFNKQNGKIMFYLKDQTDNPIVGATVELYKEDGTFIGETKTGADGIIKYHYVKKGNYTINVTKLPEGYEMTEDNIAEFEVKRKLQTNVTCTQERTAGLLNIQVLNSNNEPIKKAEVCLYDVEGYLLSTMYTDSDGMIYKTILENGTYYFKQSEEQENISKENLDLTMYKIVLDEENRTFEKIINNK